MRFYIWIFCLAFLSVGARNFEQGLSLDAPLYATISRDISLTGEFFKLNSRLTEFQPYYADHPHLGFWIQAAIFKIFGSADWSARISGHLFYVALLCLLYFWINVLRGKAVATLAILILWILAPFSNFFSNFYLDPSCLFFSTLFLFSYWKSLQSSPLIWAPLAGISLGLSFMSKGLSILGFGPAALCLFILNPKTKSLIIRTLTCLAFFALTMGLYFLAIRLSNAPDFLDLYWYRQMTNRFSGSMRFVRLFDTRFWWALIKDSYFIFPLVILTLRGKNRFSKDILMCWTLIVTFILMYAPSERIGAQYWMYIFPWMAWLVASWMAPRFIKQPELWQKRSAYVALLGVFFLQYGPTPIHRESRPIESSMISKWSRDFGSSTLYLAQKPYQVDFMNAAPLSWYADVDVEFVGHEIPLATRNKSLLLYRNLAGTVEINDAQAFRQKGWCQVEKTSNALLFVSHCL